MNDAGEISVVVIGAGNVASHICRRLDGKVTLRQIYSRHLSNAASLAESLRKSSPESIDSLHKIVTDADLYIVSVKDDAISDVSLKMPKVQGVVVHTSGSAPDDALKEASSRYGVLYPLQTFSKNIDVDWDSVPVFTYGSDEDSLSVIDRVAEILHGPARHLDGEMRQRLHIAAVFACNFPNFMWTLSEEVLKSCGCTIEIFRPLISETLRKAVSAGAENSQTGPARRGDIALMDNHLKALPPEAADIYRTISNAIMHHYGITNTLR